MTSQATTNELLTTLDDTVQDALAYFEGKGRTTTVRIDQWSAWEVLAHFAYWHDATAWGIASAGLGGPPWQLSASADEINAAAVVMHQGEGFGELISQLRHAQARLMRVARDATNLDAPAFRMADGHVVSVRQRLETIARHWRGHLQALRDAGG